MSWVLSFDQTLLAVPKGSGYIPIPPVVLPGIRASQLLFKASSTQAQPSWRKACTVVQLIDLPGQPVETAEALRQVIWLNHALVIKPFPSPSYSLRFEVPYWLKELSIQMWEGIAEGEVVRGSGAAEAATEIQRGQALYLLPSGLVALAQANDQTTGAIVGFAASSVAAGVSVSYFTEGTIDLEDWSIVAGSPFLTPGRAYFLSPDQPGQITLNPPITEGLLVGRVGTALSATSLDIEIQPSILL